MLLYLYLLLALSAGIAAAVSGAGLLAVCGAFAGAFFGLLLLHLLVLLIACLFVNKEKPAERAFGFYRRLLTLSCELVLKLGRVNVKVEGGEKLPAGRCLFVQNHVSAFDPVALYPAFSERQLFFVSKKENLEIPVGGRLMAGAGVLGLDRENNRQGVLVMRRAAQLMEGGGTVVIYPEGTRSKTGELGPFRDGCFKAAQWGGAPVAVVTVHGSGEASRSLFKKKNTIVFRVLRVFEAAGIAEKRTDEISAMVREIMEKDLNG